MCAGGRWPRALKFGNGTRDINRDIGESQPTPASSFPIETTLDLVLAHRPDLRTEVGKDEEEEDNFLPTSWAKGPSGRSFQKDEPCRGCCLPSVSVSLLQVRSPGSTCSSFSHGSGGTTQCGSALPTRPCAGLTSEPCLLPWQWLRPVPLDTADS